jgi:GT2 family glycosyltransferase
VSFRNNSELITVVITNHNRCDELRAAIGSVKEQNYRNFEIVIVDNASRDNSRIMLASEFPGVCTIALDENRGMDGYSEGFRRARGEFIFQMDNDSLMPDESVLTQVIRRFKEGPSELAAVATRVEEYQANGSSIDELRKKDARRGPINTGGYHAGGVGFRRALLERVGYYNRDVFLYGSELFLQMKLLAAGYLIHYYPEILMLHRSSNIARSSNGLYYEIRNRYWFMRHFANRAQQWRFLPWMVFHDFVYSICRKGPTVFFQALKDGLGHLPQSLRPAVCSTRPEFVAKVNEVGSHFCFSNVKNRLKSRL